MLEDHERRIRRLERLRFELELRLGRAAQRVVHPAAHIHIPGHLYQPLPPVVYTATLVAGGETDDVQGVMCSPPCSASELSTAWTAAHDRLEAELATICARGIRFNGFAVIPRLLRVACVAAAAGSICGGGGIRVQVPPPDITEDGPWPSGDPFAYCHAPMYTVGRGGVYWRGVTELLRLEAGQSLQTYDVHKFAITLDRGPWERTRWVRYIDTEADAYSYVPPSQRYCNLVLDSTLSDSVAGAQTVRWAWGMFPYSLAPSWPYSEVQSRLASENWSGYVDMTGTGVTTHVIDAPTAVAPEKSWYWHAWFIGDDCFSPGDLPTTMGSVPPSDDYGVRTWTGQTAEIRSLTWQGANGEIRARTV